MKSCCPMNFCHCISIPSLAVGISGWLSQVEEMLLKMYVLLEYPPVSVEYPPVIKMSPPLSRPTRQCLSIPTGRGVKDSKELPSVVLSALAMSSIPPDITMPCVESCVPAPRSLGELILEVNVGCPTLYVTCGLFEVWRSYVPDIAQESELAL